MLSSDKATGTTPETLPTPSLLVDKDKLQKNIQSLKDRTRDLPVRLRPHLKTAKSIEAALLALETPQGPATISTLAEAAEFGRAGITDLLYSVCIAPQKLEQVSTLRKSGIDLIVVVDSLVAAQHLSAHARRTRDPVPVLIEIDVDGHRSGIAVDQHELLIEVGRVLHSGGCDLQGIMAHAGESYYLPDPESLAAAAHREQMQAARMASVLRDAGLPSPVVSVGSTPTAFGATSFDGITEVRAGVFMFFDLVQAGIGVCTVDDIALSVLATVIGHQPSKGWAIIDVGWTAMSLDRGTSSQAIDQFFGVVCDSGGKPIDDLVLLRVNQEHGIIGIRPDSTNHMPDLKIGDRLRILPNHACATSNQHDVYHVLDSNNRVVDTWRRFRGW